MRALCFLAITACTVGGGANHAAPPRPPPDPDRMPSEVLDKQKPGADTSDHPTLWRSEANPHPWLSGLFDGCGSRNTQDWNGRETFIGCGGCTTQDMSGAGTFGLVALAVLSATRRRRRRSSRRGNASETRRVAP